MLVLLQTYQINKSHNIYVRSWVISPLKLKIIKIIWVLITTKKFKQKCYKNVIRFCSIWKTIHCGLPMESKEMVDASELIGMEFSRKAWPCGPRSIPYD